MKTPISIYRYTLHSRAALNVRSVRREYEGALIRVGRDNFGYGCIHPWPELGDLNIEQIIKRLSDGKQTALARRALICASYDGEARLEGRSLFENLTIPRSHATLIMNKSALMMALESGFDIVKVKVGGDLATEAKFIREQACQFPNLRWRLDFNNCQSFAAVKRFLQSLGEVVRGKVDFIEDAFLPDQVPAILTDNPYHIAMAVDRGIETVGSGFAVAVIKPALNDPEPLLMQARAGGQRVVFTSYMDHPLGQCFAAWQAALADQAYPNMIVTCGLVTHGLFELNSFSKALGKPKPEFHPAAGTGLGFDELLESLPWKRIV